MGLIPFSLNYHVLGFCCISSFIACYMLVMYFTSSCFTCMTVLLHRYCNLFISILPSVQNIYMWNLVEWYDIRYRLTASHFYFNYICNIVSTKTLLCHVYIGILDIFAHKPHIKRKLSLKNHCPKNKKKYIYPNILILSTD